MHVSSTSILDCMINQAIYANKTNSMNVQHMPPPPPSSSSSATAASFYVTNNSDHEDNNDESSYYSNNWQSSDADSTHWARIKSTKHIHNKYFNSNSIESKN